MRLVLVYLRMALSGLFWACVSCPGDGYFSEIIFFDFFRNRMHLSYLHSFGPLGCICC